MVDALGPDERSRLLTRLSGTRFSDVRWVDSTGSTNADLLADARAGAPEGAVLVADHQDQGRGRLDRTWEAPPGSSLLVSILLRPQLDPEQIHLVSTAVGVAAVDAVRDAGVSDVALKWPNDLVAETPEGWRKLGGILAEAELASTGVEAVVVGIGINVNWPDELPAELDGIAVAANHLLGAELDRIDLLARFLGHLDGELARLATGPGRATLLQRYRDRCATIGSVVRVELVDETFTGRAVRIDEQGHLVVEVVGEAEERVVTAGDVVHLRVR